MNLARWIFGLPFAFLISLGVVNLFIKYEPGRTDTNLIYFYLYHIAALGIGCSLFVFLSCFFIPAYKKYVGIATVAIGLLYALIGLFRYFNVPGAMESDLSRFFINNIGLVAGLGLGFVLSYVVFGNKKWSTR